MTNLSQKSSAFKLILKHQSNVFAYLAAGLAKTPRQKKEEKERQKKISQAVFDIVQKEKHIPKNIYPAVKKKFPNLK